MAHVEYEIATGAWICSGTVVAPRVVLTAAHCVEDIETDSLAPAPTYKVITGAVNVERPVSAQVSSASQVVVFPRFKADLVEADAGLVILSKPVRAPALPLLSPPAGDLLAAGTPVSIAGWGMVDRKLEVPAAAFHVGSGKITSQRACRESAYAPSLAIQLCVNGAPKFETTACLGDSGGPALARRADGSRVEVGIFSLVSVDSQGQCSPREPAVYTRVDRISGWVERWIVAAEAGGPEPMLRVQHPRLPLLTIDRAKQIATAKLGEQLPESLVGASEKDLTCHRIAHVRVGCKVAWIREANDLYGTVSVYFGISGGGEVTWDDRFVIHWMRRACRPRNEHPRSCPIHTIERIPQPSGG